MSSARKFIRLVPSTKAVVFNTALSEADAWNVEREETMRPDVMRFKGQVAEEDLDKIPTYNVTMFDPE